MISLCSLTTLLSIFFNLLSIFCYIVGKKKKKERQEATFKLGIQYDETFWEAGFSDYPHVRLSSFFVNLNKIRIVMLDFYLRNILSFPPLIAELSKFALTGNRNLSH